LWKSPKLVWRRETSGNLRLDTSDGRTIGHVRPQPGRFGHTAEWGSRSKPFMTVIEAKGWLEWIALPYWRRW